MEELFLLLAVIIPFTLISTLVWLILKVRYLNTEVLKLKLGGSEADQTGVGKPMAEAMVSTTPAKPSETPPKAIEQEPSVVVRTPEPPKYSVPKPEFKPVPSRSLLDLLTDVRLLIWIGGAALALGGIFIVKYSIENALLGPWGRILAGVLLGIIMLGVSEWFRKQQQKFADKNFKSYLPLTVAAAGFITLYGAAYAGFVLYGLISPIVTVFCLSLIAAAGLAYSLIMGPWLALLALIGAYCVPVLVSTNQASTEMLYLYLAGVLAGSFLLLRYRPWIWVVALNQVFSFLWFIAWAGFVSAQLADVLVLTIYMSFLLGLHISQFGKIETYPVEKGIFKCFKTPEGMVILAVSFVAFAGVVLALIANYVLLSAFLPFALLPVTAWIASRNKGLEKSIWVGQIAILLLIFIWPSTMGAGDQISANKTLIAGAILAGLFYVLNAVWRIRNNWQAFKGVLYAAYMPLLIFCLLFWKYNGFGTALEWSLVALFLAGGYVAAAGWFQKQFSEAHGQQLVGLAALGATGSLSLAFSAGMEAEWLTIAFALQILAIAWINRKITLTIFRPIVALLAIIVIVRLEMDSEIAHFLWNGSFYVDWYLYGFGVPLIAFVVSWYWFAKDGQDYLTGLLESGSILFWVSLIALTVRQFMTDNVSYYFDLSFAEASIHVVSWMLNALGLYWFSRKNGSIVRKWAWKILGGLAMLVLVPGLMFGLNPFINHAGDVGSWYGLNWLANGYLIPAGVLFMCYKAVKPEHYKFKPFIAGLAGLLGFWYINSEIRHVFAGQNMVLGQIEEMEMYFYSLGWLLYACLIMFVGIAKDFRKIRQAALLLLLMTAFKVFFFDMAALEGLLRAGSFLGLGACLIGLAFLYQRFGKTENNINP